MTQRVLILGGGGPSANETQLTAAHRHNMTNNQELAKAMDQLLQTGEAQKLSPEECQRFHADFRGEVAPLIDAHREEQRRGYEKTKEIALR